MTMTTGKTVDALAERAQALLEATEALHAALRQDGDLDALAPAYACREAAFDALVAAAGVSPASTDLRALRPRLGVAGCAAIERVRALDRELLARGGAQFDAIRDERKAMRRRRAVVRAHGERERQPPRVVTVKA